MKHRQLMGWITLLFLARLASGCGGGGGDTAAQGPPPAGSHVGRLTELIAKKGAKAEPKKTPKSH